MAKIRARLFGMAAVMILSACTTGAQAPTQSSGAGAPRLALSGLPATFKETLPCADCAGIDYQLNLRPDHTFASRMVYEGRNASFGDSGSWG
ncbi:MAG: copper resistance protein NlpE N-terminal domain-containing protein, partial [Terracidiphilus sp.]